jgi:hypothetical protein
MLPGYLHNNGHWLVGVEILNLALQAARATGNRWDEGAILGNLGSLASYLGDYDQASHYQQQSLTIARDVKDYEGEIAPLNGLANLATRRGTTTKPARSISRRSLSAADSATVWGKA